MVVVRVIGYIVSLTTLTLGYRGCSLVRPEQLRLDVGSKQFKDAYKNGGEVLRGTEVT
jgi:hypothetical protein